MSTDGRTNWTDGPTDDREGTEGLTDGLTDEREETDGLTDDDGSEDVATVRGEVVESLRGVIELLRVVVVVLSKMVVVLSKMVVLGVAVVVVGCSPQQLNLAITENKNVNLKKVVFETEIKMS